MRYAIGENSTLVGQFEEGSTVHIKVLVLDTDTLLELDNDVCVESEHMPGMYIWKTSNISSNNNLIGYTNLLYEMTSEAGKKYYGKIVYAGYVEKVQLTDLSPLIDADTSISELLYLINARI